METAGQVGMNLARVEIYTVLVILLLRYRFEYTEPSGHKPQVVIYLSATPNRIEMQVTPRT
jgi:cytochrome P450|eukprot:COSAG01_NODE_8408_length_2794_cov_37.625232_4_plen_61_part_00